MPAPTGNRPYVLRILRAANGQACADRVTVRRGARLADVHGISPVGGHTPRSSRTYADGSAVEFRYVDPRPDAPWCVQPKHQEV